MSFANQIIFFGAALLLISIVASAVSSRVGAPLLLIFLLIGMLAGENGPGGIDFHDFRLANLLGSLALAVILFDGGLRTRVGQFRVGLWPAVSLATVGVVITALLVGAFASWIFRLDWLGGLLVGAIVASTDAAAVFSLLHARGIELKERVSATLEIESGTNDPMAVFLTISVVELLASGKTDLTWSIATTFILEMSLGAVGGWVGGRALAWLLNRLSLPPALYPLLAAGGGVFVYGAVALLHGSGFLAIYLAGVVLGNRPIQGEQNILRIHDALAWLAQIGMFLMLGLLATPTQLVEVGPQALAIALFLILVARPVAVFAGLAPFRFPWRDQIFIAWVGLRGAVPIILATFPLLANVPNDDLYFNTAFFVVLVSLMVQGWTLGLAAKWLKLEVPPPPQPVQVLDLDVADSFDHGLLGYRLGPDAPTLAQRLSGLDLPEGARLAGVIRSGRLLPVHADDRLRPNDYVYVLCHTESQDAVNRLFAQQTAPPRLEEHEFFGEFVLNGGARLGDLAAVYGFELPEETKSMTAAELLAQRFSQRPVVGDRIRLGRVELVAMEIELGRVAKVGLNLHH